MDTSILVFNPAAASQNERRLNRQTLTGLRGKVVGFIDNAKPNFDHLVDDVAELLVQRHGVSAVIKHRKRGPSIPASDNVIQELSEQCDAVITGSAE